MSGLRKNVNCFPLNKKCIVRFKGEKDYYNGCLKKMYTKDRVIFFGDIKSTSRIVKLPGSGLGEIAEIYVL